MKNVFLFHLKSIFHSWDIQIFVFPSSSLFLVNYSIRGWSRTNFKVYEVINCLNKNLIQFVWCLQKEKRYDIETLPIDRVINKEHFHSENVHQKLVPGPFLILVNNQDILKEDHRKPQQSELFNFFHFKPSSF